MVKNIKDLLPVGTKVVIKVQKLNEKSKGGIVLTSDYLQKEQDNISEGTLMALGPVAFADLVNVNEDAAGQIPDIGSHVFFVKYAGKAISIPDDEEHEYRIMHDEDIFAYSNEVTND